MTAIHEHARLFPTCDLGSQNYEQWAVQKEREGEWKCYTDMYYTHMLKID